MAPVIKNIGFLISDYPSVDNVKEVLDEGGELLEFFLEEFNPYVEVLVNDKIVLKDYILIFKSIRDIYFFIREKRIPFDIHFVVEQYADEPFYLLKLLEDRLLFYDINGKEIGSFCFDSVEDLSKLFSKSIKEVKNRLLTIYSPYKVFLEKFFQGI